MEKTIHQGRNLKRFREILGIKQEGLAYDLGEDWSQKKVSMLESKERIDLDTLEKVSAIMKIPIEAFQKFDEEKAVMNIQNNYEGSHNQGANIGTYANFNPIDKWVEAMEEIKALNADKISLYERMLKEKDEMIAKLERLVKPQ